MSDLTTNTKKQTQKGFSLIELMVVIAIIAILAAVAVPMYSNYTTRAKFSSEISKLGGLKAEVSEMISNINSGGSIAGITTPKNAPKNADVADDGTITITTDGVIDPSSIILKPSIISGSVIEWKCTISGSSITQSKCPSTCTPA